MVRFVRAKALAWAWMFVVIALCLWPSAWMPFKEGSGGGLPHTDKAIHFGMFAMFGLLWTVARPAGKSPRVWATWVALVGLALAAGTEFLQGLPAIGRDTDLLDALTDVAGLLTGGAAGGFAPRRSG